MKRKKERVGKKVKVENMKVYRKKGKEYTKE